MHRHYVLAEREEKGYVTLKIVSYLKSLLLVVSYPGHQPSVVITIQRITQLVFVILFYWIVINPVDFENRGQGFLRGERGKTSEGPTQVKGP